MQYLSPERLKKTIKIFDRQIGDIPGLDGPPLNGVEARHIPSIIGEDNLEKWSPWVSCVGYSSRVEGFFESRARSLTVARTSQPEIVRCRDLRLSDPFLPISRVAVYRTSEELLLPEIARRLNIRRNSEESVLLPNHVWELGVASLGDGVSFSVYLVRAMEKIERNVVQALSKRNGHGLVLMTADEVPEFFKWPSGLDAQCVWDALAGGGLQFHYNPALLNAPSVNASSSLKIIKDKYGEVIVAYDSEAKKLSVRGEEDWYISGEKGAAVVEYFVDQAMLARRELKNGEVIRMTQDSVGSAKQVSTVFSGNPNWRRYISSPRWSFWGLKSLLDNIDIL